MSVIDISGMGKTYHGKRGARVEALKGLSLQIEPGEVFGFLGPNGAGKSTTIKALVGLISPTEGSASLCGKPVTDAESRGSVGYLPENPAFYDFMTAIEYLNFVGESFGMTSAAIENGSLKVLELLDLSDAARRPIRTYSKGMVQRLGLAQAMLHDPDVYILDEPMSGLDPLGRSLVKDIIRKLKVNGKTVFFSTHITADVEAVCDRVGIIVGGQLRLVESVDELLAHGIEGYRVRAKSCPESITGLFNNVPNDLGAIEFSVSQNEMKYLLEKIVSSGGEIDLIEPKRKDLESFFLDVVSRSNG